MKKKVFIISILGAIALCVLTLCVLLFAKHINMYKIDSDQVEKITIWYYLSDGEQELNAHDAETFIKLFNKAKYGGQGTGEGGTPEYGLVVYYVDGSYLRINDFRRMGRNFEVSLHDANGHKKDWYYMNSQDLYEFVSEMVNHAGE